VTPGGPFTHQRVAPRKATDYHRTGHCRGIVAAGPLRGGLALSEAFICWGCVECSARRRDEQTCSWMACPRSPGSFQRHRIHQQPGARIGERALKRLAGPGSREAVAASPGARRSPEWRARTTMCAALAQVRRGQARASLRSPREDGVQGQAKQDHIDGEPAHHLNCAPPPDQLIEHGPLGDG